MKNREQGEKNGEQRMNEDGCTGLKKRLSAVEICACELLCLHHALLFLILFAVIHGYHNRRDLRYSTKSKYLLSHLLPH